MAKGRPLHPFANHTMLAHQWRKPSICWCWQPKTSIVRRRNASCQMPIMVRSFLCLSCHSHTHPTRWNNVKNQLIWVKVAMTTLVKVWVPSIGNMMSICQWKFWKEGNGRTWICSCETWNFMSLTMDVKPSQMVSWKTINSPPWV